MGFIILIHGLGEHSGRYHEWAKKFHNSGFGFIAVDLPGHGKSDGKRGHIKSYRITDEMIGILISECSKTFQDVPIFLYGHSLGGGIVLSYILRKKPDIKGAIITSPWIKLAFEPSRGKKILAGIMRHILPSFVQRTGLVTEHLSRINDVVDKYTTDPLVHDFISVSLFYNAISAGEYCLQNAETLSVPVLLMHGLDDQITSPAGSSEVASKSKLITLKIWEGGYHELHNEPFSDRVFNEIISWIKNLIP